MSLPDSERWRRLVAEDFLESPAEHFAAPFIAEPLADRAAGDLDGAVIGRYRLLEQIGRGGMGAVWLAERADGQFEQRVALKLIKRGMDSDEILARFLRERQILARLEHPSIARLLDGGVSADGRPYFVMEHVSGVSITQYCDEGRLSIDARLGLFVSVCRAVQYAHRNLVVHRDLKPSNVLVTERGEVKLLDFGVAKVLRDESSDEATAGHGSAVVPMTPEYASPEQAAGLAVTTASDVYQLGILLYELLTGRRPYAVPARPPHDIERILREREPAPPSAIVARIGQLVHRDGRTDVIEPNSVSSRRSTTLSRLRKRLRGDLDAIAFRALRNEPDRRYPSSEALAEDLERHLAHRPLRFGGASWKYRSAKFMRRYRTPLSVGAIAVAIGIAFGSVYLFQIRGERDRARREAAKATEGAALLRRFFEGWSPDAADRGAVSAEKVLADATDRAERELDNDPETLASSLSMLGDLHSALGQTARADSLLGRALAIQERLSDKPSADLAATLARRGRLYVDVGRPAEAEVPLRRALATYLSLLEPERPEVLLTQFALARALYSQDKLQEAEELLREVLRKSPNADAPLTTEIAAELGYVLFLEARYDDAAAILRPALVRQRRVFGRLHRSSLRTMRFLAGALRDRGELAEAEALAREALAVSRILYGEDHSETGASLLPIALVYEREGDFAESEQFARAALAYAERTYGAVTFPTAVRQRILGSILLARGDSSQAETMFRRALAGMRRSFPQGHPDEGDVLNRLALCLMARRASDAVAMYREAARFENARPQRGPYFVTDGYEYLADAARRMGDLVFAERLFRRALGLYERQLPRGHPYRSAAVAGLGGTLLDAGRVEEAEPYLREGLAQWKAARPPAPERVAELGGLIARAQAIAIVNSILRAKAGACKVKHGRINATRGKAGWRVATSVTLSGSSKPFTSAAVWTVRDGVAVPGNQLTAEITEGCP
jgi:eukaryotic-like serine/threonine-protein kinase